MLEDLIKLAEERMEKAVSAHKRELASVRAGRATPSMLDKVTVEYYGSPMPVNQIAGVSSPEPRMLVIAPWDKSMLSEIEKAIQKSDLGLNPSNDGSVIRLVIPQLSEQRRQELAKVVKRFAEDARVAIRNIRRDINDDMKKREKAGEASEDEVRRLLERCQNVTDKYIAEIDRLTVAKEQDLKEV